MKTLFYLFFGTLSLVPSYAIYREAGPRIAEKVREEIAVLEHRPSEAGLPAAEIEHKGFIDASVEGFRNYFTQHPSVPGSVSTVSFYDRYFRGVEHHEESREAREHHEELLRALARREEALRILAEREEALRILKHREEELRIAEHRPDLRHEPEFHHEPDLHHEPVINHEPDLHHEPIVKHEPDVHHEPGLHHEPNGGLNTGSGALAHREPDWFSRNTSGWTSPFQRVSLSGSSSSRFEPHPEVATGSPFSPGYPTRPTAGPVRSPMGSTGPLGSTGSPFHPATGSTGSNSGPFHPAAPVTSTHTGPPPSAPHPRPVVTAPVITTVTH